MTRGRAVRNKSLRYSGVEEVEHSRVGGGYSGITPTAMLHTPYMRRTPISNCNQVTKRKRRDYKYSAPKTVSFEGPPIVPRGDNLDSVKLILFISSSFPPFSLHPCTSLATPLLALTSGQELRSYVLTWYWCTSHRLLRASRILGLASISLSRLCNSVL